MRYSFTKFILPAACIASMAVFAFPALAVAPLNAGVTDFGSQTSLGGGDLKGIIATIINIFLGFLALLAVVLIMYGGFRWMTSGGDEKKVTAARRTITQAVIGLAIILSSWAITVFLLNALTNATGATPEGGSTSTTPPGGCVGFGCGGVSPTAFIITGMTPSGTILSRRAVVDVTFRYNVDPATIMANGRPIAGRFSVASGGTEVPGTMTVQGADVQFTPDGACPDPNVTLKCFEANTDYTITITPTNIKSTTGASLQCGGLAPPCTGAFKTGDLVDTQPPQGAMTLPPDGLNFDPANGLQFGSYSTDDTAIAKADYFVEGAFAVSQSLAPSANTFSSSIHYDTASVSPNTTLRITGKVSDITATSVDMSGAPSVIARAAHCFDSQKNSTETDVDCGGNDCGACDGSACTSNTQCSSGVCAGGICVSKPVVTDIQPRDGAPGTFVTITGMNFGTTGKAFFLGATGAGDDKEAVNACAGSWSPTQIILQVPTGVVAAGPIAITNGSSQLSSNSTVDFTPNTTERPGLCSISPQSANVGVAIQLTGTNLSGASKVFVGSGSSNVTSSTTTQVNSTVPVLNDGVYNTTVLVGTLTSNPVQFRVASPLVENVPTITDILPAQGPVGQYVTILGANFGTTGSVRFVKGSQLAVGDTTFPQECGNGFWTPNSVTVKVPAKFSADNSNVTASTGWTVAVNRTSGTAALSNTIAFEVTSGAPSPGVCKIDPTAGPVNTPVQLFGEQFGTTMGTVQFTSADADAASVTWDASKVIAAVPGAATTGPVSLKTASNTTSNPVFFQVGSCLATPSLCATGERCCDNGSCSATNCAATVENASYSFRFTTGLTPITPHLLTQCDELAGTLIPSPAPLATRSGGNQVCVNAVVSGVFDVPMDPTTLNSAADSIQVFCSDAANTMCGSSRRVDGIIALQNAIPGNTDMTKVNAFSFTPTTNWLPGEYKVFVKKSAKALAVNGVPGAEATVDPACDDGAVKDNAYCWKFTASPTGETCNIASIIVAPPSVNADEPYDAGRSALAPNGTAIGFTASPGANVKLCLKLRGPMAVSWKSADPLVAAILASTNAGVTDPATATIAPYKETVTPLEVLATSGIASGHGDLNISFQRPQVVLHEPNCGEACVNAGVRATFSTHMNQGTVTMKLWRCADEQCLASEKVGGEQIMPLTWSTDSNKPNEEIATASPVLEKAAFYRVLIPAHADPSGTNCLGCSLAGISLEEKGTNYQVGNDKFYSWTFKTRNDATPCQISNVVMEPVIGSVAATGGTVSYTAVPKSAPDSCSASGQSLNAKLYNWNWALTTSGVGEFVNGLGTNAPVTSGALAGSNYVSGIAAGYTSQCLKRGADAAIGSTARCGNGVWEPQFGEGCDDGNLRSGDGCKENCLIEPFTHQVVPFTPDKFWKNVGITGVCGDGNKQRADEPGKSGFGEECDDGNADDTDACGNNCLATGNSTGTCGNGFVEPGEECDDGNAISGDGCTGKENPNVKACLLEGSVSSVVICGDKVVNPSVEDCDNVGDGAVDWPNGTCNTATCLWKGTDAPTCGNGTPDAGEQCDHGNANGKDTDGCSANCLLRGSSASYAVPSFCGDGIKGQGEAAGSEAAVTRTLVDPVQIIRAVSSTPATTEVTAIPVQTTPVKGTATFKIGINACGLCAVQTAPACGTPPGDTACNGAGGACQNSVAGPVCVIANASTADQCAAAHGVCISVKPALVLQCGTNATPTKIPSPAPLIATDNTAQFPQDNVCSNALVSGVFNVSMDPATLRANIAVYDCGAVALNGACTSTTPLGIPVADFVIDGNGLPNSAFHISPRSFASHAWLPGHTYLVAVKTGVASADGLTADPNPPIGGNCGGVTGPVHACWKFRTSAEVCPPSSLSVSLIPNPATSVGPVAGRAAVLSDRCLELNGAAYVYGWTSVEPNSQPEIQASAATLSPAGQSTQQVGIAPQHDGVATIKANIVATPTVQGQNNLTVQLAAEACPAGEGIDAAGVCRARPTILKSTPSDKQGADAAASTCTGVARNTRIEIDFDTPMDEGSLLAPGAVTIQYDGSCVIANGTTWQKFVGFMSDLVHGVSIRAAIATHSQNPEGLSYCSAPIGGTLEAVRDAEARTVGVTFLPSGVLQPLKWYRIGIASTVRSDRGVGLQDPTGPAVNRYFHTAQRLAPLDSVVITDSRSIVTTAADGSGIIGNTNNPTWITNPDEPTVLFDAQAFGRTCPGSAPQPITSIPGVYAWTYGSAGASGWSPTAAIGSADVPVVAAQKTLEECNAGFESCAEVHAVTPKGLSEGIIAATATISENTLNSTDTSTDFFDVPERAFKVGDQKTGTLGVSVFLCKNPWPKPVNGQFAPYLDTQGSASSNFSMMYCRDAEGGTLLPELKAVPVEHPSAGVYHEFLFINSPGQQSKAKGSAKTLAKLIPTHASLMANTVDADDLIRIAAILGAPSVNSVAPGSAASGTTATLTNVGGKAFAAGWDEENGLVGNWRLDETKGSALADVSGNKNNGTGNGSTATTIVTGKINSTRQWNGGAADDVSINDSPSLAPAKAITISVWAQHDKSAIKPWQAIATKGDSSYRLHLCGNTSFCTKGSSLNGFAFGLTGTTGFDLGSTTIPATGAWYHLVGTYDGATANLYVNGVLASTTAKTGSISPNKISFDLGHNAEAAGREWSGLLDEVRVYDRALSSGEVSELYNATSVPVLKLKLAGQADIFCTNATLASSTSLTGASCSLSGAAIGKWDVQVTNPDGQTGALAASFNVTDSTPPSTPANLTAKASGSSQIDLAWNSSTDNVGVVNYVVERCQGAGCTPTTQIATPSGTTYSDTGLLASTTYGYHLRAKDAAGNTSGTTLPVYATTGSAVDVTPPTAPTKLTASALGSTQMSLSWTAATDANGINAYFVERCQGAGCSNFTLLAKVGGTSYTDSGLTAATAYSYRVNANDPAGNLGPYSNTSSATTNNPAPTLASITPNTKFVGDAGFTMTVTGTNFIATSGVLMSGSPRATTYVSATQLTVAIPASDMSSASSFTVTVSNSTPGGGSSTGQLFTVSTAPDKTPPTTPSGLIPKTTSTSQINVSWTASTDNVGVAGYLVDRCQGASCTGFTQIATVASGVTYSDSGLLASTSYSYRISAYDAAGNISATSASAAASTATPPDTTIPTTPATFTATAASTTAINLSWSAATDDVAVTGYVLESCQGANCTNFVQIAKQAALTFSNTGLLASTGYRYRVAAYDAAGNVSAYSIIATATTQTPPDTTAPSVPTNLAVTSVTVSSADLSWGASTDAGSGVSQYLIERCAGNGCTNFVQIAAQAGTTFKDSGLGASSSYVYQVKVKDVAGNTSAASASVTATTATPPDTQAPSAPSLNANPKFPTQIDLSWNSSTDNVGIVSYDIERCQGANCANFTKLATATGTFYADASVSSSTTFSYRMTALDAAGNVSTFSNIATATTTAPPDTQAPSTPAVLNASVKTTTQIDLSWNASTDNVGVTSYQLERCAGASCVNFAQIATPTGTSYSDTGLIAATSYSYRVLALDAAKNKSAYSNTDTVTTKTPPDTQAPTTPNFQSATASQPTIVDLAWKTSTDNVGVTDYIVERCSGKSCTNFIQIATATGTTYSDVGASPSTTYGYRIKAQDAVGNVSPASGVLTATTPAPPDTQAPGSPANLAAKPVSPSEIDLDWSASTDNIGVTSYAIESCLGSNCGNFSSLGTSVTPNFIATNLSSNTGYTFRVTALDAAGNVSAPATVIASTPVPPNPTPTLASITPSNANAGASGMTVAVIGSGFTKATTLAWSGTPRTATFTSPTELSFQVTASDLATDSVYSVTVTNPGPGSGTSNPLAFTVKTPPDTKSPTDPTTLKAASASATQVDLAWTASTDDSGVDGYVLERCSGSTCTNFIQIATPNTQAFSDTGLTQGTNYSYRVRAFDASGNLSAYSNVATAVAAPTPDTSKPTVPLSLAISSTGSDSVSLTWKPSTDDVAVTGYAIERCAGSDCTAFALLQTLTKPEYADAGLLAGASYTYRVQARDGSGNASAYSNTATIKMPTPPDTQAPTAPGTPSGVVMGSTQADLSWGVASDNVGVTGYALERCQGATCTNFIEVATTSGLTHTDADLQGGATYRYRVIASDAAGNKSVPSTVINVTTTAIHDTTAPGAPSGVTAAVVGETQVNFSWTASSDNVGVVSYSVERCEGITCTAFAGVGNSQTTTFSDNGLKSGTAYRYRVRASDAAGNMSDYSVVVGATTSVPKQSATIQINLSWGASQDNVAVVTYHIERCNGLHCEQDPKNFAEIASSKTTTYSDTGLAPGTNYSYRVRAEDAAGNRGGYSNAVSATTVTAPESRAKGTKVLSSRATTRDHEAMIPVFTGMTTRVSLMARQLAVDVTPPTPPGTLTATPLAPPTVTSIDPVAQPVGGVAFTLTVKGTNFASASIVQWNGDNRPTTFVNPTTVTARIPETDLLSVGTFQVSVLNPPDLKSNSKDFSVTVQNHPVPTLSNVDPTVVARGDRVNITLTGTNFAQGVTTANFGPLILVNSLTVQSGTTAIANILVGAAAQNGVRNVSVTNAAPGGGTATKTGAISVNDPKPVPSSISPQKVTVGDTTTEITLRGTGFVTTSVVKVNGASLASSFISPTELRFHLDTSSAANPATLQITVSNTGPGGGDSAAQSLSVEVNPTPVLTAITPGTAPASGSFFTLTVLGSGFVPKSIVRWNGTDRITTFVDTTTLKAEITSADMAAPATASVTVFNPAPSGGTSAAQTFSVTTFKGGDVIGVRVIPNPDRLSALEWYGRQGFTGHPVAAKLDGYDAVQDEHTLYVNALNPGVTPTGRVQAPFYSNIYVISYTSIGPDVTKIFEQVKTLFRLNANLRGADSNVNLCRDSSSPSSPLLLKGNQIVPCTADAECVAVSPTGVCASERAKMFRDLKRITDYYAMTTGLVAAEKRDNSFPTIASGSFLRAFTTSVWPSWGRELGAKIGSAPTDPLNKLNPCQKICTNSPAGTERLCASDADCTNPTGSCIPDPAFDPATCWDSAASIFICAEGSHVYTYQAVGTNGGISAKLASDFELSSIATNFPIGICETSSPHAGERCAGVGANDEACGKVCANDLNKKCRVTTDCPGSFCQVSTTPFKCVDAKTSPDAPVSFATANSCDGARKGISSVCGDGVVGQGETCERGENGGTLSCANGGVSESVCNSTCSGFAPTGSCYAKACGNGKIEGVCGGTSVPCVHDTDCSDGATCGDYELCDDGASNGKYGFCNTTCSGKGSSCGDGVIAPGEDCDCGDPNGSGVSLIVCGGKANGQYGSICSLDCRSPGPKCGDHVLQTPEEQCEIGEVKTGPGGRVCSNDITKVCATDSECGAGNTCLAACTLSLDGRAQTRREQCTPTCSFATPQCFAGKCGDGAVATDKVCSNDGATSCTSDANCLIGSVQGVCNSVEECDDGNSSNTDACSNTCKLNFCGDGNLNDGIEQCDNGDQNGIPCDAAYGGICNYCSRDCHERTLSGGVCGNSIQEKTESCDGKDFGGKICVGGLTPGIICAKDEECGTGGACMGKFCSGGLTCTVFNDAHQTTYLIGPKNADAKFVSGVNFVNYSDSRYKACRDNQVKNCSNDTDCGTNGHCDDMNPVNISSILTDTNGLHVWGTCSTKTCSNNRNRNCSVNSDCTNNGTCGNQACYDDGLTGYCGNAAGVTCNKATDAHGGQNIDNFSLRCTGYIRPRFSGTYTFHVLSDDGSRLYVNNQKIISSWVGSNASQSQPAAVSLTANQFYPVTIEHFEGGGGEVLRLAWQNLDETGNQIKIVPPTAFSVTANNDASQSCPGGSSGTVTGICLGGQIADGTACAKNSTCGAGGICSFVRGVCKTGDADKLGTECRSSLECGASGECARGTCNGGAKNSELCSATADCGANSTCTFAKCNQACSSFCPSDFQPLAMSFRAIGATSKCVGGHRNNVGGLCTQDADCTKATCSVNSPDCIGGTHCDGSLSPAKCVVDASFVAATCTSGLKNPDGTCALCAPATSSSSTVSLGNYPFVTSAVSCDVTTHKCTGGIYDESNIDRTCEKSAECWDIPDHGWVTVPACRSMGSLSVDIDNSGITKQPLWVVFITDNSSSMMSPGYSAEGDWFVPFDCNGDGNATNDSRISCAIRNLFGKDSADATSALDAISGYDPNLAHMAMINFGAESNAAAMSPKESFSGADTSWLTKNPANDKEYVKVGSWDAQVYARKRAADPVSDEAQFFVTAGDVAATKDFNRTEYKKIDKDYPTGGCPDTGAFDLADALLKNRTGKRVVILLTDACGGNGGSSGVLSKAAMMKNDKIDVYAVSYGIPLQGWQLAEVSSDCSSTVPFEQLKSRFASGTPISYSTSECSSTNGFFYQVTAQNDVKTIYQKIINQVSQSTTRIGDSVTASESGFARPLNIKNLTCDPTKEQTLPLKLNALGYGKVKLSNIKGEFCPTGQ